MCVIKNTEKELLFIFLLSSIIFKFWFILEYILMGFGSNSYFFTAEYCIHYHGVQHAMTTIYWPLAEQII